MGEVNLDRLRELAGHLRNACRQLRVIGKFRVTRENLQDFDSYLNSIGRFLQAEL